MIDSTWIEALDRSYLRWGEPMNNYIAKFFLLIVLMAFGLPSCGPRTGQNGHGKGPKSRFERGQYAPEGQFDDDLEEFELIDEMDDDFFDEPASDGSDGEQDDFAWADDDKMKVREVLFDFNRDAIRSDQEPCITKAVFHGKDVASRGNYFVVEGHADAIGKSRIYNLDLSERRAHRVANRLTDQGVPQNRIKVVGRGQEMLKIVADLTPDDQAPNRRVEFYEITI